MKFAQPYYSIYFGIILIFIGFLIFRIKNKKKALKKFAQESLLKEMISSFNLKKQKLKFTLIILSLTLAILALMRPQWGFQWQEIKRKGLDILIAIDTSKSMLANDVMPNRLERSKLAVKDLIKKLQGDRIGLIAFSGTAFLQCPLTVDYNGFLLALNDLKANTIPYGGTSISSAINTALKRFDDKQRKYKILIIITDGEDHQGDALKAAEKAKKENIKIFCVGIGTSSGELIKIIDDKGVKTFLKDKEGRVIKSRLNENILKQIAVIAGGSYLKSSATELGLNLLYEEKLSKMEKKEIKTQMAKLYHERFQIPLAIAFLLLLWGTLLNK